MDFLIWFLRQWGSSATVEVPTRRMIVAQGQQVHRCGSGPAGAQVWLKASRCTGEAQGQQVHR